MESNPCPETPESCTDIGHLITNSLLIEAVYSFVGNVTNPEIYP